MSNVLKELVNISFSNGEFPTQLHEAIVCPAPKKATLDKMCCKIIALFPISDTTRLSWRKLLLLSCKIICAPMTIMRSSSRQKGLSIAQKQLRCVQRLTEELYLWCCWTSAAFDTVDCQILLHRLLSTFHIIGMALKRISSYLSVVATFVFLLVVISLRQMQLLGPKIQQVLAPTFVGFNLEFRKDPSLDPSSLHCI